LDAQTCVSDLGGESYRDPEIWNQWSFYDTKVKECAGHTHESKDKSLIFQPLLQRQSHRPGWNALDFGDSMFLGKAIRIYLVNDLEGWQVWQKWEHEDILQQVLTLTQTPLEDWTIGDTQLCGWILVVGTTCEPRISRAAYQRTATAKGTLMNRYAGWFTLWRSASVLGTSVFVPGVHKGDHLGLLT
jgi:hypothetical protein